MATIESIQAAGGDYTTPQAWYDDHKGDITGDANAPYIGEMAAESFGSLDMQNSTTDVNHYFHLRAQSGSEFDGDFDGSYPSIESLTGSYAVYVVDEYARIENIVVKDIVSNASNVHAFFISGDFFSLNTCGVWNINSSSDDLENMLLIGIYADGSSGGAIVNCAIGYMSVSATKFNSGSVAYAIRTRNNNSSYVYNNAMENIVSSGEFSSLTYGVYASSVVDAYIVNNVIGLISSNGGLKSIHTNGNTDEDIRNNATTDAFGGTNSQDNITPANEFEDTTPATLDLHIKLGGQCEDNGINLIESAYTNAPTVDSDGDARPATGAWSISINNSVVSYAYEGTGGILFGGAAITFVLYEYSGTGGTLFGGSATTSFTVNSTTEIETGIRLSLRTTLIPTLELTIK